VKLKRAEKRHSSEIGARWLNYSSLATLNYHRMILAKAKQRGHRQKALARAKSSVKLHEPITVEETANVQERIKVPIKSRSALVQGDGRSMGMDID